MYHGNRAGPPGDSMPVNAVRCSNAVHQKLPPSIHHLRKFERLNMVHQIPDLGVIVVGNQIGRVALLTLTRWRPSENDQRKHPAFHNGTNHFGFRVSNVLPLQSQESRSLRPMTPLLGVAVGPVQGQSTTNLGPRRYRLLMTYYDHTILSYEILREPPDGQLLIL